MEPETIRKYINENGKVILFHETGGRDSPLVVAIKQENTAMVSNIVEEISTLVDNEEISDDKCLKIIRDARNLDSKRNVIEECMHRGLADTILLIWTELKPVQKYVAGLLRNNLKNQRSKISKIYRNGTPEQKKSISVLKRHIMGE